MIVNGMGDLARHFALGRQHASLNQQLDQLTQELASGRKADVSDPVTKGYGLLADFSRSETLLQSYAQGTAEARLFTEARQTALEKIQNTTQALASDLLVSSNTTHETREVLAQQAHSTFLDLVSSLNATVMGKSLFSGTATDGPSLAPAADIMAELQTEIAGAATPEDVRQAVLAWFDGPRFDAVGFLGNEDAMTFQLSESQQTSSPVTAKNETIVALLAETAIAALATDVQGFDPSESQALLNSAGQALLNTQNAVTRVRSELGVVQERIEAAETQNAAQLSSLQIARSEYLSSDPFETATALENTRLQLEALYTVTARLSGLSLTSFLR